RDQPVSRRRRGRCHAHKARRRGNVRGQGGRQESLLLFLFAEQRAAFPGQQRPVSVIAAARSKFAGGAMNASKRAVVVGVSALLVAIAAYAATGGGSPQDK